MALICQRIILYNSIMSSPALEHSSQSPEKSEREKHDFDLHVGVIKPGEEGWNEAAALEAKIFMRRGFVGSAEELQEEYEPYLPETSMLIAKMGSGEKLVACARVVEYDPQVGFKTIDDGLNPEKTLVIDERGKERLRGLDQANTFEVGTVSAYPTAGAELFGMIIGHGLDKDPRREYIVASLDEKVLEGIIKPIFGDSVKSLGPATEYIGSRTVPIMIDLARAYDNAITNNQFPEYVEKVKRGREAIAKHEY